jgi:hypothetical protein
MPTTPFPKFSLAPTPLASVDAALADELMSLLDRDPARVAAQVRAWLRDSDD